MLTKHYVPTFEEAKLNYVEASTSASLVSLSPELRALIRIAVALTIPSIGATREALSAAKDLVDVERICGAVAVAATLRAGAATAYGRLVFKYIGEVPGDQRRPDREYMKDLRTANPEVFKVWQTFMASAHGSSSLSEKEEEIIAIACAAVSRCVYCLETHGQKAKAAGATPREIGEAVHLAVSGSAEATLIDFEEVAKDFA